MNAEQWKKQAEIYKENLLEAKRLFDSKFTLTDEEIMECACFLDVNITGRYKDTPPIKDADWEITGLKNFARAILRKAQNG